MRGARPAPVRLARARARLWMRVSTGVLVGVRVRVARTHADS